jgi:endonuclease YncB( thermonuclease family)
MTMRLTSACTPTDIHDGDTFMTDYVEHSNGIRQYPKRSPIWYIRLAGIACNELKNTGGTEAREATRVALRTTTGIGLEPVWLQLVSPDQYGNRLDAWVYRQSDEVCINDLLVAQGWAVPWNGRGNQPPVPYPPQPPTPVQGLRGYRELADRQWEPYYPPAHL